MGASKAYKEAQASTQALTQQLAGLTSQMTGLGGQTTQRGIGLMEPFITQQNMLASGQPGAVMSAASSLLGPIARNYAQARQNIFNEIAPGAARESELARIQREQAAANSAALSGAAWQAPQNLASLGGQLANLGVTQVGTGLSAAYPSMVGSQSIMQEATRQGASTIGAIGDIARLAGSVIAAPFTGGTSLGYGALSASKPRG